jgi:hypothetical protein
MQFRSNDPFGIFSLLSFLVGIFFLFYFFLPVFMVIVVIGFVSFGIMWLIAKITGKNPAGSFIHVRTYKTGDRQNPPPQSNNIDFIETTLVEKEDKDKK